MYSLSVLIDPTGQCLWYACSNNNKAIVKSCISAHGKQDCDRVTNFSSIIVFD